MRDDTRNTKSVSVQNSASPEDQLHATKKKAAAIFRYKIAKKVHLSSSARANFEDETIASKSSACNLISTEDYGRSEHANP